MDIIALISGKGGSGKTAVFLLLAHFLAFNEKRVLLIDCDLGTHGATCFFEGKLFEKEKYLTFINIFQDIEKDILNVKKNIDFIPSNIDFSLNLSEEKDICKARFKIFSEKIRSLNYDVMILDCQAGYSIATDIVTSFSDKNLAILEGDVISASALRVLYAQLSEQLKRDKTYQIFNKLSYEENKIFSDLKYGTIFTNLTPILFDWNISKAFLMNEFCDICFSNIYNIANVLFPNDKFLKIIKNADITEFSADVIVNSANHRLMMGRGVCGAIYRKAGRFKLWRACRKFKRPIDFGSAVITPAFHLKSKFIIHTASKRYIDGKHNEEEILRNCYLNSLKLAEKNNCKSIVFPLISSGIYGFPKEKALETAVNAIKEFLLYSENMEVYLIVNERDC